MKHFSRILSLSTMSVFLIMASACVNRFQEGSHVQATDSAAAILQSKVDLNLHPMDRNVCDPFTGGSAASLEKGIQGQLFYKTSTLPIFHDVESYMNQAQKSDKTLFFADMNVPTRLFSEGFSTQTTGVLTDDSGNKLIEYFGIRFDTTIMLSANDDEGDYELALLSDDGTRLRIQNGDGWQEIIDNDGDHPTRMGCSSQILHMTHNTPLITEVDYYQGPRYHIANVLMWRKASVAGQDPACGNLGNNLFFDPNNNSTPMQAYNDLLSRGWKVLTPDNFFVNQSTAYNPCVQGTPPVISGFQIQITDSIRTDAYFDWTTDIPASSQIRLINQSSGAEILTSSDNLLRTSHQVHVTGLTPGTTYQAQAVSVSQDLGTSMSAPLTFTTEP